MAESIYKLFDYESPAALRSSYLKGITSPTSGGDLYSQLAQAGTNTGALLGYGLGRMFGYDAPGVNKAQAIDQIMSEAAKGENPLAQAKMAYDLFSAQGMGREAQIAMERLAELQKEAEANAREAAKLKARETLATSLSTLDPSNPEDQLKLATLAAQAGEGSMAGTAFTAAGSLKKTKAEKEAETQSAKNRTKAVKGIKKDIAPEVADMIGADKEIFAKFVDATLLAKDEKNKTEIKTVGDRVQLITYKPADGTVVRTQDLGAAPKPAKNVITIDQRGLGQYAETVGTEVAKEDVAFVNTVEKAADTLPKINETLKLLKTGDITTGFGAEFLLNVNRARSQLMADKKAGKTVTDTQVLDAMLGSEVFPMIDALGIGARGLDTPAEREFLRGVFTGTIQMNKETLVRLTEIRKNVAERAVTKFNKRLGEGYFKRYEEALGRNLKPIELPAQEPTVSNWE